MRILCLLMVFVPTFVHSINKFICQHATDSISCNAGFVIKIRSVNYGRTSNVVCNNNPSVNCYSSGRTTGYLATKCNNRNVCQLTAESNVIGEDPCPGIPKYLDLQYDCDPIPTTTTTTTTTTPPPSTTPQSNSQSGPQVCHEYLVSGPHGIPDYKLTASSTWSNRTNDDHSPSRSRLFTTATDYGNGTYLRGGWSAGTNDKNQYIQAEFNSVSVVRGIVTQGQHVNPKDNCCKKKVTKYQAQYSVDGSHWEYVKDAAGNPLEFPGNHDQETPVTNMLPCPIVAKYIRLRPVTWDNHIALRFDTLGCPTTAAPYGQCPQGWKERPGSNECYLITFNETKGWDDARQACRLAQGDLVKVDSIQERDWLKQEITQVKNKYFPFNPLFQLWIGLENRPRTDSKFYKWADGTPLDQNILPWSNGRPDNYMGIEHCGEFVNTDINDVNCNSPINYICEKKKYWSAPSSSFTPAAVTAPAPTKPTQRTPSTAKIFIPVPIGGNVVQHGLTTYYRGCYNTTSCYGLPLGDYQSCTGCHDYMTCAPSGDFIRPCPANLSFDSNSKACTARSSTCRGP